MTQTFPLSVSLGRAIRIARRERHLSQTELALRAGLHRTYLGGIERGERNPSLRNLHRIAAGLRMAASELLAVAERIEREGA